MSGWILMAALAFSAPLTTWASERSVAVGAQYDTSHVYVEHGKMDDFINSLLKTFGGTTTKRVTVDVTPTPSETFSQRVLTPVSRQFFRF